MANWLGSFVLKYIVNQRTVKLLRCALLSTDLQHKSIYIFIKVVRFVIVKMFDSTHFILKFA